MAEEEATVSGHGELDCHRSEVVSTYLAGELPEPECDAFEEHYFACDRCYAELRRALELRAALGEDTAEVAAAAPPRRSGRSWTLLVAAAVAVLLLGLSVWLVRFEGMPGERGEAVLRGAAEVMAVEVQGLATAIELRWQRFPGAERYRVSLFTPDGELHEEREIATTELRLEVRPRRGEPLESAARWVVRVEALDATLQVVARSRMTEASLSPPQGPPN